MPFGIPDFLLQLIQQQQETPTLGQIANQPFTPPFAGGSIPGIGVPQGNPYELLQTIISQIQNQPLQQAPEPGKVQSILNALQGGIAVALSKDPSSVLTQQLQGREQQRMLKTQQLQQRQNLINQATLQAGFQQASDLSREQAQVRQDVRQNAIDIERERRKLSDFEKQQNIALGIEEKGRENLQKFNEKYRDTFRKWEQEKIIDANLPEQE